MKYIPVLTLSILTILLSACGGSSKPTKQDMQKAMFQKDLPYITFHKFEANIVENPELAKQNKYEAYIEWEFFYNEPLYVAYSLINPFKFKNPRLMPLRELAFKNEKLLKEGKKGLSRVLLEIIKANQILKHRVYAEFFRTEKGWQCEVMVNLEGDSLIPDAALARFWDNSLIWGSPEHLAELAEHGLTLPGRI